MLMEGLGLMVVGMSTVFIFLVILVISMMVLARLTAGGEEPAAELGAVGVPDDDGPEIAVILAAIAVHQAAQQRSGP